jgi:hypothetical protein
MKNFHHRFEDIYIFIILLCVNVFIISIFTLGCVDIAYIYRSSNETIFNINQNTTLDVIQFGPIYYLLVDNYITYPGYPPILGFNTLSEIENKIQFINFEKKFNYYRSVNAISIHSISLFHYGLILFMTVLLLDIHLIFRYITYGKSIRGNERLKKLFEDNRIRYNIC